MWLRAIDIQYLHTDIKHMAATGLHISLSAEPVFQLGGLTVTNSMITSLIVTGLLLTFAIIVNRSLTNTTKPAGLQNVAEWIIESLYSLVHSITGDLKKTSLFFPFIATFFLFVLLNNWFGLLPGVGSIMVEQRLGDASSAVAVVSEAHEADNAVLTPTTMTDATTTKPHMVHLLRAGTADLNTTLALGLISIFLVQFFGVKFLHLAYFSKFFNFSSPIMFFVGLLELVSEVGKILSFGFRLFGNIFAGEVLLAVMTYLAGLAVPIPFYGLEVFVGFIQALVFAMLSLVFMNMATLGHGDEH